MNFVLECSRY